MSITTIEDNLLELIQGHAILKRLKKLDTLPGPLDVDLLKKLATKAPGVYLLFAGFRAKQAGDDEALMNGSWIFYVVTGNASGRKAKRRGSNGEIGAYEIIDTLTPLLHGHDIVGEGSVSVVDSRNLYNGRIDKLNVALYAITCTLPMNMSLEADESLLNDFVTFHSDMDIQPHEDSTEHNKWLLEPPDYATSEPDAEDKVTNLDT